MGPDEPEPPVTSDSAAPSEGAVIGRSPSRRLVFRQRTVGRRASRFDPVTVALDDREHRADQRLAQQVGHQAQIEQPGVGGPVVVGLGLDPGVVDRTRSRQWPGVGPADRLGDLARPTSAR